MMKSDKMNDIYREELIEYYKNPSHKMKMDDADLHRFDSNPLCGDEVEIFLKIAADGAIEKASFIGDGCVISIASAEMACEYMEGKKISEIKNISREEWLKTMNINPTPTRVKCAMLAIVAMKRAVGSDDMDKQLD